MKASGDRHDAKAGREEGQMRRCRLSWMGALALLCAAVGLSLGSPPTSVGAVAAPSTPGYVLAGADGGVFTFGSAGFHGSGAPTGVCDAAVSLHSVVINPFGCDAITTTPDGGGYWLLNHLGTVTAYGDAGNPLGGTCTDPAALPYQVNWTGLASSPSGQGFWITTGGGYLAACGDARGLGNGIAGSVNAPIVGLAATPDGAGLWMVASDGGVFSFGDARFFGSMGGQRLNKPIVGMAVTPDGGGYWLVASDGGIFSFGDAVFSGSMGGKALNAPMVGLAANPHGPGYWTVASDGGVFSFGGAPFEGSMGGHALNAPIIGIAATPAGA